MMFDIHGTSILWVGKDHQFTLLGIQNDGYFLFPVSDTECDLDHWGNLIFDGVDII